MFKEELVFFHGTLLSKRNTTSLKLPFFWRIVHACEKGVVYQDPMSGSGAPREVKRLKLHFFWKSWIMWIATTWKIALKFRMITSWVKPVPGYTVCSMSNLEWIDFSERFLQTKRKLLFRRSKILLRGIQSVTITALMCITGEASWRLLQNNMPGNFLKAKRSAG